jgi:formate--tetrahydrofolate ligase
MLSDIDIAQRATLQPVSAIASKLGIPDEHLEPYGRTKAKVSTEFISTIKDRPNGKLILPYPDPGTDPSPAPRATATSEAARA